MSCTKILVAALLSVLAVGCSEHHDLAVEIPDASATPVEFAWGGEPARSVTVFRCDAACPAVASLPSYKDEEDPTIGDTMWKVAGAVPAGDGTIEGPVQYGMVDGADVTVVTPATPLSPGEYLVRVVTMRRSKKPLTADWGTGWSTFTVGDT
ncbi:MAG: hypothetical protein AAF721_13260 [Myxococcota bacterium]